MRNVLKLAMHLVVLLLFCQCENSEIDNISSKKGTGEEPVFSETSKQFGEAVATELNGTVINLHKQGVNYLNANKSDEFKEEFYDTFLKASPSLAKTRSNIEIVKNSFISEKEFVERIRNLTNIQLEFIDDIIKECNQSSSYPDFFMRINKLNVRIYENVPEIQQERLLRITSVLYYCMKEMNKLEEQGLIPITPQSAMRRMTIKTRREADSFGDSCRSFLATVWVIAVGEPTPAGEIVASFVTVLVGAVWMYEVVVCAKSVTSSNREYCINKFEHCYSPIMDGCAACLRYCLANGAWPPYSSHKCGQI